MNVHFSQGRENVHSPYGGYLTPVRLVGAKSALIMGTKLIVYFPDVWRAETARQFLELPRFCREEVRLEIPTFDGFYNIKHAFYARASIYEDD